VSSKSDSRLTPRERLTRGLTYSAVGPVDITRGALGLGVYSAQATAASARRRYRKGKLARELAAALGVPPDFGGETIAKELATAQEVVAGLPRALQEARRPKHRRRPWLLAAVGVVALAGGAVAFSVVRRSSKPDPSPRPPSVDVEPRP
jgi:hypothetical protein